LYSIHLISNRANFAIELCYFTLLQIPIKTIFPNTFDVDSLAA